MISVQPTCRFCMRIMFGLAPFQRMPNGTVYSYMCRVCHSEQLFESDGKPLEYSFQVGEYILKFNLPDIPFQIVRHDSTKPFPVNKVVVLQLDFVPHNLAPHNTTEERIKTLILFS